MIVLTKRFIETPSLTKIQYCAITPVSLSFLFSLAPGWSTVSDKAPDPGDLSPPRADSGRGQP